MRKTKTLVSFTASQHFKQTSSLLRAKWKMMYNFVIILYVIMAILVVTECKHILLVENSQEENLQKWEMDWYFFTSTKFWALKMLSAVSLICAVTHTFIQCFYLYLMEKRRWRQDLSAFRIAILVFWNQMRRVRVDLAKKHREHACPYGSNFKITR